MHSPYTYMYAYIQTPLNLNHVGKMVGAQSVELVMYLQSFIKLLCSYDWTDLFSLIFIFVHICIFMELVHFSKLNMQANAGISETVISFVH